MTRVAFLGTPDSAVPTLRAVANITDVVLVVTQPDRPRGRSGRPEPPPVKVEAEQLGLRVEQPESNDELHAVMSEAGEVDVGVVVAYGRIFKAPLLQLPRTGLLNLHFSLLPRWRGAAPVARALEAGDTMTGVTIIRIDEGLDTGPVLTAQAIDIDPSHDAGSLTSRLAVVGARLMADVIPDYLQGRASPVPQTDEGATYAHKVTGDDRPIDLSGSADVAVNKVRALAPDPGATLVIDGEPHKILRAAVVDSHVPKGHWELVDDQLLVGLSRQAIRLDRLQPPGRRPMGGLAWARGRRVTSGQVR